MLDRNHTWFLQIWLNRFPRQVDEMQALQIGDLAPGTSGANFKPRVNGI